MSIPVVYIDDPVTCRFARYGGGKRMWLRSSASWYPSLGWCPHLNLGHNECTDCGMVLDDDDDLV